MIKRGFIFVFILFLFPLLFAACSTDSSSSVGVIHEYEKPTDDGNLHVTGIKVPSNYIELLKEKNTDLHYNISAVAQPAGVANNVLHYTSSNPEIAEVTPDGNVLIKNTGYFDIQITSDERMDIWQQVSFYVRENINTALDVVNNPLSFFGSYSVLQYGINMEPNTNVGGSFLINMDRASKDVLEVTLLFNGLDIPLNINIENLAASSYENGASLLFEYFEGRVNGEGHIIIKLKADEQPALVENNIISAGETLYILLSKEYDLIPGQSHIVESPVSVTQINVEESKSIDRLNVTSYMLSPVILPVNASNKAVTYSSSNKKVATVSSTGKITVLNEGNTDIIVSSVSDNEVIGKTNIKVVDSTIRVKNIKFNKIDNNVILGTPVTVKAVAEPSNATYKDIKYYSKNPLIATVNSATGLVTTRRVGTVEIAAVSDKGSIEKTITLNVGVNKPVEPVKAIVNVPSKLEASLESNTPIQLDAKVVPSYADNTSLTYQADSSGVISVDENGLIKALKVGTGVVTVSSAKYPEIKKEISIAVRQHEEKIYVTSIGVNESPNTLYIGHTDHTIIPTLVPENANIEHELTVTADDTTVVKLEQVGNEYKVTPLAEGSAIITLETANGVKQEVSLNVKKVMNVKGYYTVEKVDYTYADETQTFTKDIDNLKGEFAINLLDNKYTVQGRLQYTPANPFNSYMFNNWRYIYENKDILLDAADKYSTQTKEALASQNVKITGENTLEYTYSNDSFKAVVYLTKVNDEVKTIEDRTMYMTNIDMKKDPHSIEGYYEMRWFYGNPSTVDRSSSNPVRYQPLFSNLPEERPTSSDIDITYLDNNQWCWISSCWGGNGENGSVTNYTGAFAVKVDGTGENAQISLITKVQMQGHNDFDLTSERKYIHGKFDALNMLQNKSYNNFSLIDKNLNVNLTTGSGSEGSKSAFLAYRLLNDNNMQFEMQFLTTYQFMYRAVKVSDRYIDLPTAKYVDGDVTGRTPPAVPDLAKIVPITEFTGTVTPIE